MSGRASADASAEQRITAPAALLTPQLRELAGRHDHDGCVPDLSPSGVRAALASLGGDALADGHDEAHLAAFEGRSRVAYGEVEVHRRTPRALLAALDLAGYDAPYAPVQERRNARRRHLEGWPDAIDAGLASLDRLSAPVARALLAAVRGLAAELRPEENPAREALAAHQRFVARLEQAAGGGGDDDVALGCAALTALLGTGERCTVEQERLETMPAEACVLLAPGEPVRAVVHALLDDHADPAEVMDAARRLTGEVIAFTSERDLIDGVDGLCEAAQGFETDAFAPPPAAQAEANRATFDPTYGRYTWGKLEIRSLRHEARRPWGTRFSLHRFHHALLELGAPPLGLLGTALGRGASLPASPPPPDTSRPPR